MGRKKVKPDKPKAFQLEVGTLCYYIGKLYDEYTNKECRIISRSKAKKSYTMEWYRIRFCESEFEILTMLATLKRKEEEIDSN